MSYPPPPPPAAYPPAPGTGPAGPVRLRGRTPRRLGWIFLALAVVLFVVGGIVIATKSLGKVNDFQRVSFESGQGTVNLDGTGKWVGYYEASDVNSDIDRVPNFRVQILGPGNQEINVQGYGARSDGKIDKLTYDYNGHKGAATFEFHVSRAGTYRVALQAVDDLPSGADVAIGRDIAGGTIAGGLLIVVGVLALIAAIILLIVGFVKRARHKRELESGQGWGGVPAPAYGGPPPGYGQQGFAPPPPGYQPPPPGYGGQQPDQPGYGGAPPAYGAPPPPPPGYQPPPPPPGTEPHQQPSFGDPTAPPKDDSAHS